MYLKRAALSFVLAAMGDYDADRTDYICDAECDGGSRNAHSASARARETVPSRSEKGDLQFYEIPFSGGPE